MAKKAPSQSAGTSTRSGKKRAITSRSKSREGKGDTSGSQKKPTSSSSRESSTALEQTSPEIDIVTALGSLPEEFKAINPRQTLFVVYYAITLKGVEAARMAGYEGDYMTLAQVATENLKKPEILRAYQAYVSPMFEKHGLTVDRLVGEIAEVALSPWMNHIQVREKKGRIVSVQMQMGAKIEAMKMAMKMLRLTGTESENMNTIIDQSQHLHFHKSSNAEEARKALLNYLKKRK